MSNLRLLIIRYGMYISGSPSCFSNKLRYVEWDEYLSKYLPSSFHPNELVELILKGSSIKQLWKNKKYLPNLRTLDLRYSIELEKIIDFGEFPNLELLNLEGCTNLVELDPSIGLLRNLVYLNLNRCKNLVKLDPSVGLLKKLVYLNLKDCRNLVSIPNSIYDLSSLEYLNMSGCSKAFNNGSTSSVFKYLLPSLWFSAPTRHTYLFPSLHSLDCLRNVDISFCHVRQVPDSIECLHWLERLYLAGNDFVTLPSLRNLSKLVYLNLEHCRLIESLPQLPFPTTIGRDHRENKYDIGRDSRENKYDWITGLVIFNCPKLGERERCSSMTFSWMMQFIKANPPSYLAYFKNIQIVTPGSEIPSWINNQSMGDSIQMDRSPILHDNNNNFIGFVCCAVFTSGWFPASYRMGLNCQPSDCDFVVRIMNVRVILEGQLLTTKSSHLWMIYFPREYNRYIGKIRFYFYEGGKFIGGEGLGLKVKSCGYRWICKQDLQEVNFMTNHKKYLASKCKILAIEDETQAQPKP